MVPLTDFRCFLPVLAAPLTLDGHRRWVCYKQNTFGLTVDKTQRCSLHLIAKMLHAIESTHLVSEAYRVYYPRHIPWLHLFLHRWVRHPLTRRMWNKVNRRGVIFSTIRAHIEAAEQTRAQLHENLLFLYKKINEHNHRIVTKKILHVRVWYWIDRLCERLHLPYRLYIENIHPQNVEATFFLRYRTTRETENGSTSANISSTHTEQRTVPV